MRQMWQDSKKQFLMKPKEKNKNKNLVRMLSLRVPGLAGLQATLLQFLHRKRITRPTQSLQLNPPVTRVTSTSGFLQTKDSWLPFSVVLDPTPNLQWGFCQQVPFSKFLFAKFKWKRRSSFMFSVYKLWSPPGLWLSPPFQANPLRGQVQQKL